MMKQHEFAWRRRRRWRQAEVAATESGLYGLLAAEFQKINQHYVEVAKGGLTVAEVFELLTLAAGSFVKVTEALTEGVDDAAKKAAVLKACETFYQQVLAPLDIPGVPNLLESTIVDPLLGKVASVVMSGIIDGLVAILKTEKAMPEEPEEVPSDAPAIPQGWEPY